MFLHFDQSERAQSMREIYNKEAFTCHSSASRLAKSYLIVPWGMDEQLGCRALLRTLQTAASAFADRRFLFMTLA